MEAGGKAVGILADSLQKAALAGKYRVRIREKRLALVSPFNPDARFNVGNAMGHNKYIYALANFALIISADIKKGGTWTGATEELKREECRPMFVRMGEKTPLGNRALLDLGAQKFPEPPWTENLKSLLSQAASLTRRVRAPLQQRLFGSKAKLVEPVMIKEETTAFTEVVEEPLHPPIAAPTDAQPESVPSIYDAVQPVLLAVMEEWISAADLARKLDVRKVQLDEWLKRAVNDGAIEIKNRPVRFRRK